MNKRVGIVLVCVAIRTLAMSTTSRARAQNLFEADAGSGHIYKFTPGGAQSTFASGLMPPEGLAFDSAGNLFEADYFGGHIYKFTSGGAQSSWSAISPPTSTTSAPPCPAPAPATPRGCTSGSTSW